MVKEIIIHLGDSKTGSTAIQTCLVSGGYQLPSGQLCYPAKLNHNNIANGLSDRAEHAMARKHFRHSMGELAATFAASDAGYGIISAEVFEFISPERLKDALDQFFPSYEGRIRLISYVRPHHSKVVSAFAERIKKTGLPNTMEELFDNRVRDGGLVYHTRFSQWRAVFGDAFTLRPFVREQLLNGDVVADFLSYVSGHEDVTVTKVPQLNSSLSVKSLSMLMLCHKRLAKAHNLSGPVLDSVRGSLGWNMAPYLSTHEMKKFKPLKMHKALAEKILETCYDDAVALDADFLTGAPMLTALQAAPNTAIAEPQSLAPADQLTPSERSMVRGLADFIGHIAAADPEHFVWAARREVEEMTGAETSETPLPSSSAEPAKYHPPRPSILRRIINRLR